MPQPPDLFGSTTYPDGFVVAGKPDDTSDEDWTASSKQSHSMMDRMYSENAEGLSRATATTLHFWGQFTSDLPEAFQPDGPNGHQYIRTASLAEADAKALELRETIAAKWPNTKEWAGESWYRWMIPDGRQMTLKFE